MEDVLLEPYGGEVLSLSVSATTSLTAALAVGGLIGFGWASRVLSRGADPFKMAAAGAWVGIPAFMAVIMASPLQSAPLFTIGVLLIGVGGGLFGHGTLTATMNRAPAEQVGLAMGAWGAVQATAAGLAMAAGGLLRDLLVSPQDPAQAYVSVYALEVGLLVATLLAMGPLFRKTAKGHSDTTG
jgi:BCD family chlorophyll transporter-like MFS transporter